MEMPSVLIKDAQFPSPFAAGLLYSVPARGGWTIVHVGMLLPEAHEIFVCAAGCLRGVVLSAAEMNLTDRFSTVAIEEKNVLQGDMEELIIDGAADILNRLPHLPKAVLLYSSCIHHFTGCDISMCLGVLRKKFPSVDFADCEMTPTMRKSGYTPDELMRLKLYSLIKPKEKKEKHCMIAGNCFSLLGTCDIKKLLSSFGWTAHEITECNTYEEYQEMAACTLCICMLPSAKKGAMELSRRLNMKFLYLPFCYGKEEIRRNLFALADAIGAEYDGGAFMEEASETALLRAKEVIGDTPVAIDYTFTPRPLGLARMLKEHGFNVKKLFLDSMSMEEKEDFEWLKEHAPCIVICPAEHAAMRKYPAGEEGKWLALGQKAAFFTQSPHFVNLVENGGLYGFDGTAHLAMLMEEAFNVPKDIEKTIEIKGLGCESCL